MSHIRLVQYPVGTRFEAYTDFQVNYLNYRSGWPIRNTEVWVGDDLWMKTNSIGCKGRDLDPDAGVIGFFGDSSIFGMAFDRRAADSWPSHVSLPGYQVLNAAVEGHAFDRICARYAELRRQVDFSAVVIGGTWHNLVYNDCSEDAWLSSFTQFSGAHVLAICTLPTSLIPASSERGIDDLIQGRAGRQPFLAWGDWDTSAAGSRAAYEGVLRYNQFVRRYCRKTGAILVDLHSVYRPASYDDLPDMFLDPAHARPELYPALAECVNRALAGRLKKASHPIAASPTPAGAHEMNHNVYPLW